MPQTTLHISPAHIRPPPGGGIDTPCCPFSRLAPAVCIVVLPVLYICRIFARGYARSDIFINRCRVGIKQLINGALGVTGYEIRHTPSVANEMARGKYRWLQERRIATVLDIGANVGQFAEMMRAVFPRAAIHSFEPLGACCSILARKKPSLEPMFIYPVALGKVDGVATMYHNDFSASSSLLPMTGRHREAFPHTGIRLKSR